jgi:hypothetical protein
MGRLARIIGHNQYAITRPRGDIPGCVPAVDVFIERDIDDVRKITLAQGEQYAGAIRAYIDGEYGIGNDGEIEMWYRATKGNVPMPVLRNPSKRLLMITGGK